MLASETTATKLFNLVPWGMFKVNRFGDIRCATGACPLARAMGKGRDDNGSLMMMARILHAPMTLIEDIIEAADERSPLAEIQDVRIRNLRRMMIRRLIKAEVDVAAKWI